MRVTKDWCRFINTTISCRCLRHRLFVGQVKYPHHSDQLPKRSYKSSDCYSRVVAKLKISLSLWMSWWPAHIWFVILIKCGRKSANMYCKMLIINLKSEVNLFRSEGSDWLLVVPNRGTDNKVTQGAILDLSKISIAKNEYIFSSFSNLLYIRRSDFGDNGVKMMKIEDKLSKIIWFTC